MSLDVNISEPDEFNCNELHSCIEEIAKIKNVKGFSYHVDYISGKGENFIANIFRVAIKDSEDESRKFSVIVKTLINTTRQELFQELHSREVLAFEVVIKKFIEIQQRIDENDRIVLPECLYTRTDSGNEVIVLEDLKVKYFDIDNRLASCAIPSFAQSSAVIKNLAKFHALSFIYKKHYAETFDKVKNDFEDIIFSNSFLNKSQLRNYFYDAFESSTKLVEDPEARHKLEVVQTKLLEILRQYVKCEDSARNVLCHGDCWINNVMFQNKNDDNTKICLIDFQTMRYANPATDIVHFVYLCTDSQFRSEFLQTLLNEYYDTLESFLKTYSIDVNSIYTREEYFQDIENTKPFGLLVALMELKLVTTVEEDHLMKGSTLVLNEEKEDETTNYFYKLRVNDIVSESVVNGVLNKLLDKINIK